MALFLLSGNHRGGPEWAQVAGIRDANPITFGRCRNMASFVMCIIRRIAMTTA